MQKQIELRRAVEQVESRGPGRRIPEPLRSKLVTYIQRRREAGGTLKTIANEIGISFKTIRRWVADDGKRPRLRRVQLIDAKAKQHLTVHGPCGVRVEGMAVEQLAELLRRLG